MGAALDHGLGADAGGFSGIGDPFLVIRDVGKQFGNFVALERVSLNIPSGELVSFLGPSGCGKTTLLRAIAGLDPPTVGRIIQAGRDITALPPAERDFGIVFQSYALFPNLSIAENVGYGLRGAACPRPAGSSALTNCCIWLGFRIKSPNTRPSFRVVSSSASPSHAPWPQNPGFFCSMNRFPRLMPLYGCICGRKSVPCNKGLV